MGCGIGLIKYLLFIFNFIFALCGLAILVVGALAYVKFDTVDDAVNETISSAPMILFIVIGSIVFVIAFFGCCGAIRESHCMTITFASFLLTILIVQVALAIYAFVAYQESKLDVKSTYKKVFDSYWYRETNRDAVDTIQSNLGCCGVDSYQDFYGLGNTTIPRSCCIDETVATCSPDKVFKHGCAEAIKDLLVSVGKILGGIALGIAGVELIGIIFALCLANSIKQYERRGYRV